MAVVFQNLAYQVMKLVSLLLIMGLVLLVVLTKFAIVPGRVLMEILVLAFLVGHFVCLKFVTTLMSIVASTIWCCVLRGSQRRRVISSARLVVVLVIVALVPTMVFPLALLVVVWWYGLFV